MRAPLIAAGAMLAAGAYVLARRDQGGAVGAVLDEAVQETAELLDAVTGGAMRISNMAQVTQADVNHPNVRAFLTVIRRGEGTADAAGYRRIFGGGLFNDYSDHPRVKVTRGRYTSTAAGAYQFLSSTWDETRRVMNLPDFTPASQDLGAVGRIAARGALDDVKAGRLEAAVRKCAKEWASLPFSPYGQPTISMAAAATFYTAAGGVVA